MILMRVVWRGNRLIDLGAARGDANGDGAQLLLQRFGPMGVILWFFVATILFARFNKTWPIRCLGACLLVCTWNENYLIWYSLQGTYATHYNVYHYLVAGWGFVALLLHMTIIPKIVVNLMMGPPKG
jgi:hypothetical protein